MSELELRAEVIVELVVFSFLSGGLGFIMGLISPETNVENSELLQSNVLSGASEILFISDWPKAAFMSSELGSGRSSSLSVKFFIHCFNGLFFNLVCYPECFYTVPIFPFFNCLCAYI